MRILIAATALLILLLEGANAQQAAPQQRPNIYDYSGQMPPGSATQGQPIIDTQAPSLAGQTTQIAQADIAPPLPAGEPQQGQPRQLPALAPVQRVPLPSVPTQPAESAPTAGAPVNRGLQIVSKEIADLQKLAHDSGGELIVSMQLKGISPEDLYVTASKSSQFDVSTDTNTVIIRTRESDVDALIAYRNKLIQEIEDLKTSQRGAPTVITSGEGNSRPSPNSQPPPAVELHDVDVNMAKSQ